MLFTLFILCTISALIRETDGLCKRDEDAIKCENRQCAQSCEKKQCKNPRAICVCDGACGLVCVSRDLQCSKLSAPKFGSVDLSRGRKFNNTAYYSCDTGYDLVGPESRTCRSDGRWTESDPFCMPYEFKCKAPTFQLKYAEIVGTVKYNYSLGDEVLYRCKGAFGKEIDTKCEIEDGETYWTEIDLECPPIPCDVPADIENGYYVATDFSIGQKFTYKCITGYYIVDEKKKQMECLDGAVWSSEPPECKIRTCPVPKQIVNGNVKHDTPINYLSEVAYSCDQGFMLDGDEKRTCDMNGKLSGNDPKCIEIDCGEPDTPQNGIILHLQGTKWNQNVEYSCNEHTTAVGQMSSTCQLEFSPKWSSPPPRCWKHCAVPTVKNAFFTYNNAKVQSRTYIAHEQSLSFVCENEDLYYDSGELTPLKTYTCENGNWTWDNERQCEDEQKPPPTSCLIPNLSNIRGVIQYRTRKLQTGDFVPNLGRIQLFCDAGNIPSYTCKNGTWNDVIECKYDSCSVPDLDSKHSYILYENKKVAAGHLVPTSRSIQLICKPQFDEYFSYYNGITVKCENGKWDQTITCTSEGVSGPTSGEVEVTTHYASTTCQIPQLDDNVYILYKDKKIKPGHVVPNSAQIELFCNPHFDDLENLEYTTTGITYECRDGTWNQEINCNADDILDCKIPKLVTNYVHKFYSEGARVMPEMVIMNSQFLDLMCVKPTSTEYRTYTYRHKCENGKWDKEITCGLEPSESCQLPKLGGNYYYNHENKNITDGDYVKHLGNVALYCESNTIDVNGIKKATAVYFKCLNGKWSDEIKCKLQPRTRRDCTIPAIDKNNASSYNIFNGWQKIQSGDSVGHLQLVELICDYANFGVVGDNVQSISLPNIYECYNGTWNDDKMQCNRPVDKPIVVPGNKCALPKLLETHYFKYEEQTIKSDKLIPHLGRIALHCSDDYYDYYYLYDEGDANQPFYFKCINGTWSDEIKCKPELTKRKECKIPETVANNARILHGSNKLKPGESIQHLERITLMCSYDNNNGQQTTLDVYECDNGIWDREIMCRALPKPTPTTPSLIDACSVPALESSTAYVLYENKKVVAGHVVPNLSSIQLICNPQFDGYFSYYNSTTFKCVNGKWNKEIRCEATVTPTPSVILPGGRNCKLPKLHGNYYYIYGNQNITHGHYMPHSGRVALYCESSKVAIYFLCANGKWSDEIKCKPGPSNALGCKIPEIERNKAFSYNIFIGFDIIKAGDSVQHFESAELICDYGDFGEIGDQIRTVAVPVTYECFNGTWSDQMQCKAPEEKPQHVVSGNEGKCKLPNLSDNHYYKHEEKMVSSKKAIPHLGRVELHCIDDTYDYYSADDAAAATSQPLYFRCINGTWSDEITCKPESSQRQPCTIPQMVDETALIIHRSNKVKFGQSIPHLDRIVLRCKFSESGVKKSILSIYECNNGKWDREIKCRSPHATIGSCAVPVVEANNSYIVYENKEVASGNFVPNLGHIQLICLGNSYYYSLIYTCMNGKWNKEIACESSETVTPTIPSGGGHALENCKLPTLNGNYYYTQDDITMIPGNSIQHLSRIALYCESNRSPIYFKCINGKWSDEIKCKLQPRTRIDCKIPEIEKNKAFSYKIFNGSTQIKPGDSIRHLQLVELICDYGDFADVGEQIQTISPPTTYECFNGTWDDKMQCKPPAENPRLKPTEENVNSSSCKLPDVKTTTDYFYKYEETYKSEKNETFIPHLRRIGLYCASSPPLYFKCINGTWSGQISCSPDFSKRRMCTIPHNIVNSAVILQGSTKVKPGDSIQHLERIIVNCRFNAYDGRQSILNMYECINGKWSREIECRKPEICVTKPTRPTVDIVITYQINNGPIIIFNNTGVIEVPVDAKLSLRCWGYSKNNIVKPNWKFNIYGNNLGSSKYGEIFELTIDKIQMQHIGFYSCPSAVDISRRFYIQPTTDAKCKAMSDCHMDLFEKGNKLTKLRENYDHKSELTFRCTYPKEFKLTGSESVVCTNGIWSSDWPKCVNIYANDGNTMTIHK